MGRLVPTERIEGKSFSVEVNKVMLDRDLIELYGVPTRRLNEQVKIKIKCFPEDFMFQLSREECIMSWSKARCHFSECSLFRRKDMPKSPRKSPNKLANMMDRRALAVEFWDETIQY